MINEETLEENIQSLLQDISSIKETLSRLDPKFMVKNLNRLEKCFENNEKNLKKYKTLVQELNGVIIKCNALFEKSKNNTPLWYKIDKIQPPEMGEIWVKDINGTETLATCKGRAIIYPSSSFLKVPEFWRPV